MSGGKRTKRGQPAPAPWVLMGPEPWLATCHHCGGHLEKPPMGRPLSAVLKYVDGFVAVHAGCQEQEIVARSETTEVPA